MKQSSIDWLIEINKSRAITLQDLKEAKEMHGEELADAWDYVTHNYIKGLRNQLEARDNFYNYYLETFKSTVA